MELGRLALCRCAWPSRLPFIRKFPPTVNLQPLPLFSFKVKSFESVAAVINGLKKPSCEINGQSKKPVKMGLYWPDKKVSRWDEMSAVWDILWLVCLGAIFCMLYLAVVWYLRIAHVHGICLYYRDGSMMAVWCVILRSKMGQYSSWNRDNKSSGFGEC